MGKSKDKGASARIGHATSADLLLRHLGLDLGPPIIPQRVVEAGGMKKLSPKAWAYVEPHWRRAREMVVDKAPYGYLALNALRERLEFHLQKQRAELKEAQFATTVASLVAEAIREYMPSPLMPKGRYWDPFEDSQAAAAAVPPQRAAESEEDETMSQPLRSLADWPPPELSKQAGGFKVFLAWEREDNRFMARANEMTENEPVRVWYPYHSELPLSEAFELARERADDAYEYEREQRLKRDVIEFRLSVVRDVLQEFELTGNVPKWETRLARWFVLLEEHEKPIVKRAKELMDRRPEVYKTRTNVLNELKDRFPDISVRQLKKLFKRIGAYRPSGGTKGETNKETHDWEFKHFKERVNSYYLYYEMHADGETDV